MNEESHDKPYNKPGPKTGHTVDIVKQAIVVGRNKIPVPPDEVEMLASVGCTDREIAKYFGVKEDTLRRGFADYLTKGRHQLKLSLRQKQLQVALEGNVVMLIFLGKVILAQNETGIGQDENRALPWTDDIDEASSTDDDDDFVENTTLVVEDNKHEE